MSVVRIAAVAAVFVLLYASRLQKGTARQTPEGMVFALKPTVVLGRVAALLLYLGFIGYTIAVHGQGVPKWFPALFVIGVGLSLIQMPGTIVVGEDAVSQRFWFLKQRRIAYGEVMTIQAYAAGRAVRVLGDNRQVITHSSSHAAQEGFRVQMEGRTGKRVLM